jgi:hypothetical protein
VNRITEVFIRGSFSSVKYENDINPIGLQKVDVIRGEDYNEVDSNVLKLLSPEYDFDLYTDGFTGDGCKNWCQCATLLTDKIEKCSNIRSNLNELVLPSWITTNDLLKELF